MKDETLQRVLLQMNSGEQLVLVEIEPGEWLLEASNHPEEVDGRTMPPMLVENTTVLDLKGA